MNNSTLETLENIVQLAALSDEQALRNIADVRLLKLAKTFSVRKDAGTGRQKPKVKTEKLAVGI